MLNKLLCLVAMSALVVASQAGKQFSPLVTSSVLKNVSCCRAGGQTECQRHAQRERAMNSQLNLIPRCKEDGSYESLQCFPPAVQGGNFCSCWDSQGRPITSPSRRTKACECLRQRHTVTQAGRNGVPAIGAYVPQCEADGTYSKMQSHGSTGMSWCADPLTGAVKGNKARPGQRITCN